MWKPQTSMEDTHHNGQDGEEAHGRASRWLPWRRGTAPTELERAYNRFLDAVKDVLSDITTMEVNSVLVRNISADHPLTDVEFLQQAGADLADWFTEHQTDGRFQRSLRADTLTQLAQLSKHFALPLTQTQYTWIEALQADSTACLDDKYDSSDRLPEAATYQRAEYRRFLHYLQKFLTLCESDKWDDEGMLRGREQQQLRKLWELVGTSYIYAQTVVGLDGDAVSRLNEQLFRSTQGLSRENIEALIRFHNQNAEASARGRNSLMAMIVGTFQAVLRR